MVSEGTPAHTMQTQRAVEEAQAVEATWYVRIATGKLTALPSGYAEIRSSCIPRGSVFFSTLYVYFQGFSRAMIRLARRVWRFPNLTARVGSGQDMFQISRVGSGRFQMSQVELGHPVDTRPARSGFTLESPL